MNSRDQLTNSQNKPDRFISVNILPPHHNDDEALATIQEQIDTAISLEFNSAWFNPICNVLDSPCHRRCNDTGTQTTFHFSLYAPNDLTKIQYNLPIEKIRELNQYAKEKNFTILIDFVWKHLSAKSYKFDSNPNWKGNTVKDVIEYAFFLKDKNGEYVIPNINVTNEVLAYLKKAIDLYLNPVTGYGFTGLRIDAASHLPKEIRKEVIEYIRNAFPDAVIFEEVLFDGAQEKRIQELANEADSNKIYSDFVTTNLVYKSEDSFGQLPLPKDMGDAVKIRLADNNGISFTGNHDHYSAGWSIVLSMAAQRFMAKKNLEEEKEKNNNSNKIQEKKWCEFIWDVKTSPFKSDAPNLENILETIGILAGDIEHHWNTIENVETERLDCVRYLLPFANEIARELLDKHHHNHLHILQEFRIKLLKSITNRSLASMSGYFILFSELTSPFETQRIFFNDNKQRLPFLLLTIEDLINQPIVTDKIIRKMRDKDINNKYDNIANFLKTAPLPNLGNITEKKKNKNNKSNVKTDKMNEIALYNSLYIWLPYIIEYLRNNPMDNEYKYYMKKQNRENEEVYLSNALELKSYIQQINSIYKKIKTLKCSDYQTFTFSTQEDFKIVVRCTKDTTDIIILNLSGNRLTINDLDMEKIALICQLQKFPVTKACEWTESPSRPCSDQERINPPQAYSAYYNDKLDDNGETFHHAYQRIIGHAANHETNLYLGYDINPEINKYSNINLQVSLKTEHRRISEVLEKSTNNPETHKRQTSISLYPEVNNNCQLSPVNTNSKIQTQTAAKKKPVIQKQHRSDDDWDNFYGDTEKSADYKIKIVDDWDDSSEEGISLCYSPNFSPEKKATTTIEIHTVPSNASIIQTNGIFFAGEKPSAQVPQNKCNTKLKGMGK